MEDVKKAVLETVREVKEIDSKKIPNGFEALPSGGFPAKVNPQNVPDIAIARIQQRFSDPPIPVVLVDDKGREEENPNDPDYLAELQQVTMKKVMAVTNTIAMFACELGGEIPQSDIKKLKLLGHLSDQSSKEEIEYTFKIEVLFNNKTNIEWLMSKIGVSQEAVEAAKATFRSDTK